MPKVCWRCAQGLVSTGAAALPGRTHGTAIVAVPTTLSGAEFGLIGGATQAGSSTSFAPTPSLPTWWSMTPRWHSTRPLTFGSPLGSCGRPRRRDLCCRATPTRSRTPSRWRALRSLRAGLEAVARDPRDPAARHQGSSVSGSRPQGSAGSATDAATGSAINSGRSGRPRTHHFLRLAAGGY